VIAEDWPRSVMNPPAFRLCAYGSFRPANPAEVAADMPEVMLPPLVMAGGSDRLDGDV